jgi:hypothetical protein
MSDSRIVTMRKSETLNPTVLRMPFSFIEKQFGYSVDSILRKIHCVSQINLGTYPNTFPTTIQEYYWLQGGVPGSKPWLALGRLTNGYYFFYTAECADTPKRFLDGGGHMNLWVAFRYSDIIQYAMSSYMYQAYIAETIDLVLATPLENQ